MAYGKPLLPLVCKTCFPYYFDILKSNLFLKLSDHPSLALNFSALDPSPTFALGCHNDFAFSSIILESIDMPCL